MRALALIIVIMAFSSHVSGASADFYFSKRKIKVGPHSLIVEIADTDDLRARGLMYRTKLETNHGMLFIFEDSDFRSFWMKNTLIPLAIGFFDQEQKLVEVIEMKPDIAGTLNRKAYPTKAKAKYALEVNAGWFEKLKIRPGVRFIFTDN